MEQNIIFLKRFLNNLKHETYLIVNDLITNLEERILHVNDQNNLAKLNIIINIGST